MGRKMAEVVVRAKSALFYFPSCNLLRLNITDSNFSVCFLQDRRDLSHYKIANYILQQTYVTGTMLALSVWRFLGSDPNHLTDHYSTWYVLSFAFDPIGICSKQ